MLNGHFVLSCAKIGYNLQFVASKIMASNKRENEDDDEVTQKRAKTEEESENGGADVPFVSCFCFLKSEAHFW